MLCKKTKAMVDTNASTLKRFLPKQEVIFCDNLQIPKLLQSRSIICPIHSEGTELDEKEESKSQTCSC